MFPGVGNGRRDHRAPVLPGLTTGGGGQTRNHRLILHGDEGGGGKGHIPGVCTRHHHLETLPCHSGCGNLHRVYAIGQGAGKGRPIEGSCQLPHAKNCIHCEGEGVSLAYIGIGQRAEQHRRRVDHTAGELCVGAGVEPEGVNVRICHVVHAVALIRPGVVLQELGIPAVELGSAALHTIAAVVLRQRPVGVFRGLLLVEGIVARAVGAEVAKGLIDKPVVFPIFLHREHQTAVGHCRSAFFHCGRCILDGGAFYIVVLCGQHALGRLVENHNLVPCRRQAPCHCGLLIGEFVEVEEIIVVILLGEGGEEAVIDLQRLGIAIVLGVDADHMEPTCDLLQGPEAVLRGSVGKGQAVARCTSGEILASCVGEGITALPIHGGSQHRHGVCHLQEIPLKGSRLAGQLVAGGGVRHHQAVFVIVEHKLVPIGHSAGPLGILLQLHLVEGLGKEGLVGDPGIGAPVVLGAVPLQVVAPYSVLDVVAPFCGGGKHLPASVHLIQRRAGIVGAHGELLPICRGEGVISLVIHANRPQVAHREAGQHAAGQRHIGAVVVKAVVTGGQGFQIGGIVDDHMVPRRQHWLLWLCGVGGIHGIHRSWSISRALIQGKF